MWGASARAPGLEGHRCVSGCGFLLPYSRISAVQAGEARPGMPWGNFPGPPVTSPSVPRLVITSDQVMTPSRVPGGHNPSTALFSLLIALRSWENLSAQGAGGNQCVFQSILIPVGSK